MGGPSANLILGTSGKLILCTCLQDEWAKLGVIQGLPPPPPTRSPSRPPSRPLFHPPPNHLCVPLPPSCDLAVAYASLLARICPSFLTRLGSLSPTFSTPLSRTNVRALPPLAPPRTPDDGSDEGESGSLRRTIKSRENGHANSAGAQVPVAVVRPSTAAATPGKTAAGMMYARDSRDGGSSLRASRGPGSNAGHDSPLLAAKGLAPRPATAGSVRRSEAGGASGVRPMTALGVGPAGRRRPRITDLA